MIWLPWTNSCNTNRRRSCYQSCGRFLCTV